MTAAKTDFLPADAPSHESVTWHAIDWRKTLGNVRRLQARIVKATQTECCCVLTGTSERLERLEVKISRAVLRGQGRRKPPELPGGFMQKTPDIFLRLVLGMLIPTASSFSRLRKNSIDNNFVHYVEHC